MYVCTKHTKHRKKKPKGETIKNARKKLFATLLNNVIIFPCKINLNH